MERPWQRAAPRRGQAAGRGPASCRRPGGAAAPKSRGQGARGGRPDVRTCPAQPEPCGGVQLTGGSRRWPGPLMGGTWTLGGPGPLCGCSPRAWDSRDPATVPSVTRSCEFLGASRGRTRGDHTEGWEAQCVCTGASVCARAPCIHVGARVRKRMCLVSACCTRTSSTVSRGVWARGVHPLASAFCPGWHGPEPHAVIHAQQGARSPRASTSLLLEPQAARGAAGDAHGSDQGRRTPSDDTISLERAPKPAPRDAPPPSKGSETRADLMPSLGTWVPVPPAAAWGALLVVAQQLRGQGSTA